MSQIQVFPCPACGTNVSVDTGRESTSPCPFCGASIAVPEELRFKAPATGPGDSALSGPELHRAVVDWLLVQAVEQTGLRVDKDPLACERITEVAKQVLRELVKVETYIITIPFIGADSTGPKHFQTTLTREIVDRLARGDSNESTKPPA